MKNNINYKKAYEELVEYLIELEPYCDSCGTEDCGDCHRKYFNWTFNPSCLPDISEYVEEDKVGGNDCEK